MRYFQSSITRYFFVLATIAFLGVSLKLVTYGQCKHNLSSFTLFKAADETPDPLELFPADAKSSADKKERVPVTTLEHTWEISPPNFIVIECRPIVPARKLAELTRPRVACGPPSLASS